MCGSLRRRFAMEEVFLLGSALGDGFRSTDLSRERVGHRSVSATGYPRTSPLFPQAQPRASITTVCKDRHLDRNLPATSGTRFVSTFNGVNDHPGDVVLAKFRTDQQVIQVRIVPIAPEIHPDVVGALLIGQSNQLLDICGSRQALLDTGSPLQPRSVNEDVKNVLPVLQHALGAPADNHTISPRVRFDDEISAERSHGLRIEDF